MCRLQRLTQKPDGCFGMKLCDRPKRELASAKVSVSLTSKQVKHVSGCIHLINLHVRSFILLAARLFHDSGACMHNGSFYDLQLKRP